MSTGPGTGGAAGRAGSQAGGDAASTDDASGTGGHAEMGGTGAGGDAGDGLPDDEAGSGGHAGGHGMTDGGPDGDDAPTARDGNVRDATGGAIADVALRDAADAAADRRDAGNVGIVFNFDSAGQLASWTSQNDFTLGPGGPLAFIDDDAITGHVPRGALRWTATFTAYSTAVRAFAVFAPTLNWMGRTRLHFTVKVTSGSASLEGYQVYVQTSEPSFTSLYLDAQPASALVDAPSTFHDVSLPLISAVISARVAFLGIVLQAIDRPALGALAPLPAVIEIDNIWLE